MRTDEPVEQPLLAQVADEQIVRHRVGLLDTVRRLPMVGDDALVHDVQCTEVRDGIRPAHRVVVPGAVLDQGSGRADRGRAEGGDPLGDLVHHCPRGLDLRVQHLVHRDEVRAHDVPVHVLEGERQIVEGVQPVLQ